jgi:hypothetical protein
MNFTDQITRRVSERKLDHIINFIWTVWHVTSVVKLTGYFIVHNYELMYLIDDKITSVTRQSPFQTMNMKEK